MLRVRRPESLCARPALRSCSSMAVFLALLPNATARSRLKRAVDLERASRVRHAVRFAANWAEMHQCAMRTSAQVAVFDPYLSGSLDARSCAAFGARFPSPVLFAYGDFEGHAARDVLRLAQLGVSGVATLDHDDTPPELRLLLADALACSILAEVLEVLGTRLTPDLTQLVRYLFAHSNVSLTPDAVACAHHLHPKTLREHLRSAGLPPTQRLIVWMRLLHAASLLEDPARSVENVAFTLDFASVNAFRNQLQRYAAVSPTDLRARGGFRFLLREFERECTNGTSSTADDSATSGKQAFASV